MVLSVHNLAKTYKLLPSQVLASATTFDLYVLDTATRYVKYQQDVAEGKQAKAHKLSQQEMLDMIKRARGEDVNKNK